ncbi:hypothetical protein AX14_004514 [Amanita brunnescens Koide BX004]|nr:hypothetical protein AX14_004514 [Amanita brunnescens Koide BX004]
MMDSLFQTDSGRHRSDTRSTSNQHSRTSTNQHSRRTSISASVRSWLQSTQQNPPPPPPEHLHPFLPHSYSNMVQSQGPLTLPPLQVRNPSQIDDDYDNIEQDDVRLYDGFLAEETRRGQRHAQHPASSIPEAQNGSRNKSFVGGFVRGLKTLPKKVLRYRTSAEKRRPALIAEEGESTEAVTTLPRYRSNPSTPIVGPSMVTYVQATDMPVPELRERLPADALRSVRPRHPSYRVMPPSAHGLAEEQSAQVYDMAPAEPPTFQESTGMSTPPPEADQATTLYYDNPDATSTSGQPQSQSLRISYISHHTPITRAPTLTPATPQHVSSEIASENTSPAHSPSPILAHPPLSTDYRKMSLASHDATSRTTTSSYSLEPSFSSELSPVKRFLHILHSLPWVSDERITSDYHPGGSDKEIPKKKPVISWYRRAENGSRRNGTAPVNLLSPGSPDSRVPRPPSNSSITTPIDSPRLETRRARRSHSHLQPQRHHHSHGRHERHQRHHHHRRSHGRRRHRRRSTADDAIPEVHRHSPIPRTMYPSPFPYAAYPYIPPAASPRGPRAQAYPGGYVPFQPMPPSPPPVQMPVASPVYFFNPNEGSGLGDGFAAQGQPMYVVPGGFHPNHPAVASPAPSDQAPPTGAPSNHI